MKFKQGKWLLLMMLFCSFYANGQKNKPIKSIDPAIDYQTVVEIDENSKVVVSLASATNSKDFAESLFAVLTQKVAPRKLNSTEIFIRPNPSLRYGEITELIKKIRKSPTQNIKVEVSDDLLAIVSKPLAKNTKPNPLFLLAKLDKDGKISLNNEPQGTINDLNQLKNFLKEIIKERLENGIFREVTNEVEATVFIEAPLSVKFGEVIKIAQALRESGANPIGLQIDDFVRVTQIDEIN